MSKNSEQIEKRLSEFYRERIVALSDLARERGVEFFPLGFDDARESYYTKRQDDASYIHEIDSANLAEDLRTLWSNDDLPELAEIADELIDLAMVLQERESEPEDVSPFIYAMF